MTSTAVSRIVPGQASVDEGDWRRCPACGSLLYAKRLRRNLGVCPECDHHLRLPTRDRIAQLADPDSFEELVLPMIGADPLHFVDSTPYAERLRSAERASGETEAVVLGTSLIGGQPAVLAVMNFDFLGGSMGREVGRRIAHGVEVALAGQLPLVVVCASGGARMQEGVLSLIQMARTSAAFARLHEAGLPAICVLTDPTYGGVSASFASLGCVLIAERGAHVGFAGPRVVEQTIRQELPPGFQTAEFLLSHGLVDRVEHRADLKPVVHRILGLHAAARTGTQPRSTVQQAGIVQHAGPAEPGGPAESAGPAEPAVRGDRLDAWDVVQGARDVNRPTTADYLAGAFDDFVELRGDRCQGQDAAIVAGLAGLDGRAVVVIGHQKGHTLADLVSTNFGMPMPEGYRKASRLLDYAERFAIPVVTLVDTPGAHPGVEAEERGQSLAIAQMLQRITRLRTPVLSVITGEGGSGGALALCAADRVLMLERSYLSVISPEGCAAILWRDTAAAPAAARALRLTPAELLELGFAAQIVPEPAGGAQADPLAAAGLLRSALVTHLDQLCRLAPDDLLARRAARHEDLDHASVGPR